MNVILLAPLWQPHRLRVFLCTGLLLVMVGITLTLIDRTPAEPDVTDIRTLFTRFVAAQNAHDLDQVKAMLWDSPDMLLFSRGIEARGTEAAVDRFRQHYQGTWHLEPDMSNFHVAAISKDVVQILVPVVFTRGRPGGGPQSDTFLIYQTFVRDGQDWVIASILPVANTQLK
jgi:ketosteroid isomerase-like protein